MIDETSSKTQLKEEINALRQRVHDLEVFVSEGKQREDALRESEERFRCLLKGTFEGIAVTEDGVVIEANERIKDMLGYPDDEILGMNVINVVVPESRDLVQERILSGYEEPYEHLAIRKDGSTFFVEARGKAISYKGRTVRVTSVRDVTERKQAEEAYRVLVESSLQALVILQEGRIVFANPATETSTGYTLEELLGMKTPLETLIHPDDLPERLERITRFARGEVVLPQAVYRVIGKNGAVHWVEAYTTQIMWGGKSAIHAMFVDITDRKQSEDELRRISQNENERREELEKLRAISASMRQAEGSSSLLQVFTREVQEFCHADFVSSILFKEPEKLVTRLSSENNIQLSKKQSKEIHKALLDAKSDYLEGKVSGFESMLILPLASADAVHGSVMVASRKDKIKTDEKNMLIAIADMAGTALHRIDILETLEERVQQRTHDLVVLYNLITIISENWQLQDLLELSLVLTLETVKAERGIIYLTDGKESPDLKPIVQRGFAKGFSIEIDNLPDDGLARKVLKQHKALTLERLSEHPEYASFTELESYAGVPILVRGEMRGVFSLFAKEKNAFESDEIALLTSIADHLGIGIDNSILWEQSRENAALEERNRLARNLHDSVSQLLYSLTLMAGSTKKMLERDHNLEAIKNSVTRLGDTAHQALKEMRLLLYELRPAVIDSEGLINALQHRIETVEERLGMKVDLQTYQLPDLPSNVEDALYHIALEALNNIVKHSESRKASITIASKNGNIEMEISDEGKGFEINQPSKGLGLMNMRERAHMLGGELIIDSSPGNGTHILSRVEIPSKSLIES